jgi:phosphatidyl-myo-inositol alpha-mannosyltransferase
MRRAPRPLRIALVYDDSLDRFGGIPQYLRTLSVALVRAGHEVTLLVGDTVVNEVGDCMVHSLARNVRVRFNGNSLSMPMLADRRAIRSLVSNRSFDVVHVQVPYSPIMAGHLIRHLPSSTALVGTFHVVSERILPATGARALAAVTSATRRRFDEMICVSEHAARFARRTFGVRISAVVPNMVNVAAFRAPEHPPQPAVPTVVSLGALVPRKGTMRLVEAFAHLRIQLPEARLILAGDGPLRRRLERRIARLRLIRAVELIGPVAERDKPALLRGAHVLCFPAAYGESFGVVLLEAMASQGPPLIAVANPGYAEVLNSIPESLCSADSVELAGRLRELLGDEEGRRCVAARQHALVQRYDAGRVASEVMCVYQRALDRRAEKVAGAGVA